MAYRSRVWDWRLNHTLTVWCILKKQVLPGAYDRLDTGLTLSKLISPQQEKVNEKTVAYQLE